MDQITILEGSPHFTSDAPGWLKSAISDSTKTYLTFKCELRTFKGNDLLQRCRSAWDARDIIHLVHKPLYGRENRGEITAARLINSPDGEILAVWVKTEIIGWEP